MSGLEAYLGDLHRLVPAPWAEVVLVMVSAAAGGLVGWERELKAKAAGMRTLILIAIGSTIYTMLSIAVAGGRFDPGRIVAQIVPGIGFLGAGAILREHGTIVGLTTAATIWAVAAIGAVVGAGYAAAGMVLACMIVMVLLWVQRLEQGLLGPCRLVTCRMTFDPAGGKTWARIVGVFDEHHVTDKGTRPALAPSKDAAEFRCCEEHVQHRIHVAPLAAMPEVRSLEKT